MEHFILIKIIILIVLFIIAAFLSIAETSLIGMNRIRIIGHIKNNHPKAKYLKVWLKEPNKLLATLSICINAVAISASTIGAFLSIDLAQKYSLNESLIATIIAVVITIIIIIFGEISPKIFAIHNTERMGLLLISPVVWIYKIIRPITEIFVKISNLTIKIFGGKPSESIPVISSKDISTVIDVSMEEGFIDEQEKFMMSSILDFKDLQVKQIMVPRTSIVGVEVSWDTNKIIDVVMEEGYSRMPVYKDNLDNIIGIIYTKDMLSMIKNRDLVVFQDLIRLPHFVPETKKVSELLKEFKKGKFHMAVVVDEFGGTSGLITLEDILEEIVGEIQDEYDTEEKEIETQNDGSFVVKGIVEISKLNDYYKLNLPEEDDINTIGGFVTTLFGYVPKEGEKIDFGNLEFVILKSDAKRVTKVKIIKK